MEQEMTAPTRKQVIHVWGIAAMAQTQAKPFETHCMGDCGKISMAGAIDDELTGGLFVCCETTCPYEKKTLLNYGTTNSFDEKHIVHLRILRS